MFSLAKSYSLQDWNDATCSITMRRPVAIWDLRDLLCYLRLSPLTTLVPPRLDGKGIGLPQRSFDRRRVPGQPLHYLLHVAIDPVRIVR